MKSFFPTSIVRNTPDEATQDGSLLEAINTRFKDGARRGVGSKVKDEESLKNLPEDSIIYYHSQSGRFICIVPRGGNYYIEDWVKDSGGGTPQGLSVVCYASGKISHVGNYVTVFTASDLFILFWDNSSYISLDRLPLIKFAAGTTGRTTRDVYVDVSGLTTDQEKYDAGIGQFTKIVSEAKEDGYFHGHMVIRCAYKLFDGSIIMHSDIGYARGGYLYDATDPTAMNVNLNDTWVVPGFATVKQNGNPVQFDKLRLVFDTTGSTGTLKKYADAGIVKEICVFASEILPGYSVPANYDDLIYYNTKYYFPMEYDTINGICDQPSLFLIKSIQASSLSAGVVFDFIPDSLRDISLNQAIDADNFTHHKILPGVNFAYNSKLHFGNTGTKLGYLNGYFRQYFDSSYNNLIPDSDIAGIVMDGFVNHVSQPTDFKYFATVECATETGIKKMTFELTENFYSDGSTVAIAFNPVFAFPDLRGKTVKFWVQWKGDWSCKLLQEIDLKSSVYSNYSYTAETRYYPGPGTDIILKCLVVEVPQNWTEFNLLTDSFDFNEFDDIILDRNRVQVSKINNPFVFPAENSYRFGDEDNSVLGMITAQEPMTETVFGTYPLTVFTESGIYALEQGSGGVLYSNVVEVNKEVLSNPAGLFGITGGIVFVAKDGVKILSGRQVINISLDVRGSAQNVLKDDMYLNDILNDTKICNLYSYLSDSFTDYIQEAIIGFSRVFNELILCNPAKNYSYVYALDSKSWHTITDDVFSCFFHDMAYKNGEFYDVESELGSKAYLLQSRPFFLEDAGAKKIEQLLLRRSCSIQSNEYEALMLYGSNDCQNWAPVSKSLIGEGMTAIIKNTSGHYRYFVLIFAGQAENLSIISIDVNYKSRYNNKIR